MPRLVFFLGCAAMAVGLVVVGCQAPAPLVPTPAPPTATAPAATTTRVETLNAANSAFTSGDLKTSAGLYERVVNTPPGPGEGAAMMAITDFAHFRALVVLLADGREDEARAHLDALQARDNTAALARLANQLWDQYGMTGQLRGACAQIQPQVAGQAGPTLSILQGTGVTVDAQTLCSVPSR
jgi:hypothetical protein